MQLNKVYKKNLFKLLNMKKYRNLGDSHKNNSRLNFSSCSMIRITKFDLNRNWKINKMYKAYRVKICSLNNKLVKCAAQWDHVLT